MKTKNNVVCKIFLRIVLFVLCLCNFEVLLVNAEENSTISGCIYHKHTGSSKKKGGCYQNAYTTTQEEKIYCSGTMVYYPNYGTTGCNVCGAAYTGDRGGQKCQKYTTQSKKITAYKKNCGKEETDVIGTIYLRKSTDEWTKTLTLQASYESNGMTVTQTPFVWNGVASASSSLEVVENNVYTLALQADENANTEQAVLSLEVKNIDNMSPTVDACGAASDAWTNSGVMVNVSAKDLQEDGSAGCGLAKEAYSFDGGENWVDDSSYRYEKNGAYSVSVRDALGNVTAKEVVIKNVDKLGPTIQKVEYDTGKNIAATTLTVTAADLQEDGSAGCGLAKEAYSFDGGKTFSASNVHAVKQNGVVNVAVKDALGNVTTRKVTVGNIDDVGPSVIFSVNPSGWTNKAVAVSIQVKDVNRDGSNGVGLPVNSISFDGGKIWDSNTVCTFTQNGSKAVTCRDLYDNYTTKTITVNNIDMTPPQVILSFQREGMNKGRLVATVEDKESGVHEAAYMWKGDTSFSSESGKVITKNGTYTIKVRDKAGNENVGSIKVTSLIESATPPSEDPTIPEEETETETETENEEENETETETDTDTETLQDSDEESEDEMSDTEEATKEVWEEAVSMEQYLAEAEAQPVKKLRKKGTEGVILTVSLCMVLLLALLAFLFLWYHTLAVYCEEEEEQMDFLGRIWISIKDGRYTAHITENMWQQCGTTHFCFKPSRIFRILHASEEIIFLFPDGRWVSLPVEEKMETELL